MKVDTGQFGERESRKRLTPRLLSLVSVARFAAGVSIAIFLACSPVLGVDEAPQWLKQAAAVAMPPVERKVPAVVLLDESRVTVGEDGRITRINYWAVRILVREGRAAARATEFYDTDTGKVREMRAWLIRPSGEVKRYGNDQIVDVALVDNDVYNETRRKVIVASDDVEPGAVFGYETTTEQRPFFSQFRWYFQGDRLPVLLSRCTWALPAGWRAESVTFNHPNVEPTVNGSTYTWEMRNLPYIEDEPSSPPLTNLVPQVAISYFPPAGTRSGARTFSAWADVSRWMTDLSESQAVVSEQLAAKTRELTAGARSDLDRIRAIGRFAQSVNYVSIQMGHGRWRPHSSVEVLAKSYGDCKDKANLMRAMLKSAGMTSYLVLITADDPTYVREEWPSPSQFNHCIIAVKVTDETDAATIVQHPTLGRLMVFDPTDDNTPVGDLPDDEQGSLALIVAGHEGALLRMPVTPPEANKLERHSEVELAPDGSISAVVREQSIGQHAVSERGGFRGLSRPEYLKMVERWLTRGATGATVSKVEPSDNAAEGKFSLEVEFKAARYGQLMQGRLLVFKPAIIERDESLLLTGQSRKHPVVLESRAYAETVKVKLPAGFDVDELPDRVKLDAPFGSYATLYEVKDGHLHFMRSLVLKRSTIPAAEYDKVRGFFAAIRTAEQSPVVLARK
jgi:hypothetical protein